FREAHFSRDAWFRGAQFSGLTWFSEARFSEEAQFREAHFSGHAWFSGARFSDYASFTEAHFCGDAGFHRARFNGNAGFSEARFCHAWFSEAQFSDEANFEKAQFCGDADFTAKGDGGEADAFQRLSFQDARFGGPVSFENRRFRHAATFNSCVFEKAPSFHNCGLHQDTDFGGAEFRDTESDGADRAYRTLKLAMENHRARQEQQLFYALEMESRMKARHTPFLFKFFAALFLVTSNFGQSVLLPLFWFGLAFTLFYTHYLDLLAALPGPAVDAPALALKLAVDPIIRPFGSQFAIGPDLLKGLPHESLWNLTLLNRLQSILSYLFLTLGFLALRTRFKMG
ncbi:MAG: pentapeptide repeat-containing protein, partial [Candidatus Tectomicrobia bacterium]|nr:pentapeptide repeat-containing protein [Candidatus Tectomicrobia bacterium]